MKTALTRMPGVKRKEVLETVVVRDFNSGLNLVDNEQALRAKYSVVQDNIGRGSDGSLEVRQGTKLYASIHQIEWFDNAQLADRDTSSELETSDVTISNTGAWFDNTQSQTLANSTSVQKTTESGDLYMQFTASIDFIDSNAIEIVGPSDGWLSGAGVSDTTRIEFKIEIKGTYIAEWTEVERRVTTNATAPSSIWYFWENGTSDQINEYRVTVTVPRQDTDVITLGVAEINCHAYFGHAGGAPPKMVNCTYYDNSIVCVLREGYIVKFTAGNTGEVIWDDDIGTALPGAPGGWGDSQEANFCPWNGKLLVFNGIDKPLLIDYDAVNPVTYLEDIGSGSNANTPQGLYCVVHNNYTCVAGVTLYPDRLYISAQGTSGTWEGDPAPNDAIYVDVGKFIDVEDTRIVGLSTFREFLVIAFRDGLILARLGIENDAGDHTPDFSDSITNVGTMSHRTMLNIGSDLQIQGPHGVNSLVKGRLTGDVSPERVSELLDPLFERMGHLHLENYAERNVWGLVAGNRTVYVMPDHSGDGAIPGATIRSFPLNANALQHEPQRWPQHNGKRVWVYLPGHPMRVDDRCWITKDDGLPIGAWSTFTINQMYVSLPVVAVPSENYFVVEIPDAPVSSAPGTDWVYSDENDMILTPERTETIMAVYNRNRELKFRNWRLWRGMNMVCGCVTPLNRIFMSDGYRLLLMGVDTDPVRKDYVDTVNERAIDWDWELPWSDFGGRMDIKRTRHIQVDTTGGAVEEYSADNTDYDYSVDTFTVEMYIDKLYRDPVGGERQPTLSINMEAGTKRPPAFNVNTPRPTQPLTGDERLVAWPAKCKLAKLRMHGSSQYGMKILAVALNYLPGSIKR